jgi:hypothetical protein
MRIEFKALAHFAPGTISKQFRKVRRAFGGRGMGRAPHSVTANAYCPSSSTVTRRRTVFHDFDASGFAVGAAYHLSAPSQCEDRRSCSSRTSRSNVAALTASRALSASTPVDILVQGFDLAGRGICQCEVVEGTPQRTNVLLDDGDSAADQWEAVELSAD